MKTGVFYSRWKESQDKLTQQLEQNRIDYEDKLRNLLTSREFDEYRNRELEHARQELATQAGKHWPETSKFRSKT